LTHLPEGLRVGYNLYCGNCNNLTGLPEGLRVGQNLYFRGCFNLTSLPNDVVRWGAAQNGRKRKVDLRMTGFTARVRERLLATDAPGMQFLFDNGSARPRATNFQHLDEAAKFWRDQIPKSAAGTPDFKTWSVLSQDRRLLTEFLGRLRDTADYKHPDARLRLATRVCELLQAMEENLHLRQVCSNCISDALQTCGDRVIWAMNQVEVAVRLHQAQTGNIDAAPLRKLLLGFMQLEIVQAHARGKADSLLWVDEIEVFLAYESGLRETLQLPVSAENMLFARCAQVTPADLASAERAAVAAVQDSSRVKAYLQTSDPWQRHLRKDRAAEWKWAGLTPHPLPAHIEPTDLKCPFTLDPLELLQQPVFWQSGQACVVYEAAELLVHWVEHGTEPTTRQHLDLADLEKPLLIPEGPPRKKPRVV
ncbi:MAG: hypothetical protein EOO38_13730, partial [Cytophagaceae bacterium]